MPAERGFTLIELAVVLAIIGMMLAIAAPMLGSRVPATSLNAAAGALRAALREARFTAIAEGRAVAFRGDPAGGYWLDAQHRAAPAGLRIATTAPIAFFASGGSSGGRIFVDGAGGRREVEVDALTGRSHLVP